ncbi:MAG: type III pantothenate kinase [Epsilonproteobacteria bacterium]|nr:type III pantothenate kinase [Campylobacterota bacterium]
MGILLAIDIGNSNTVVGLFEDDNLKLTVRWQTDIAETEDELQMKFSYLVSKYNIGHVDGAIIGSVVPDAEVTLSRAVGDFFSIEKPMIVKPGIKTGIKILYDDPKEVGADRILNAVAIFSEFHKPSIVVDFGTAITFDIVSGTGDYLGGIIAPGIHIASFALFSKTAKLPHVSFGPPASIVGKNTIDSIKSGLYYGYGAMIDGLIERVIEDLNFGQCIVASTGGQAGIFSDCSKMIKYDRPNLTLIGLKILYERNR